jgi:hypothetical protein
MELNTVKEAYMREGPEKLPEAALNAVARKCSECARDYLAENACYNCAYNLALYVDRQRAMLMRTGALVNRERYETVRSGARKGRWIGWAVRFGVVFGLFALARIYLSLRG